jgi:hypothetical protein
MHRPLLGLANASLEILDAPDADTGELRQAFLRQTSRLPVFLENLAESLGLAGVRHTCSSHAASPLLSDSPSAPLGHHGLPICPVSRMVKEDIPRQRAFAYRD